MSDNVISISEQVNKRDLQIILEVNKKAIEIETAVADQNEEIINLLEDNKKNQEYIDEKIDKVIKQSEDISKDLYKIQILFLTGIISLVMQVISIFVKH